MNFKLWRSGIGTMADATAQFRDGPRVNRPAGIARSASRGIVPVPWALLLCLIFILNFCLADLAGAAPPNTEITNVARAIYSHGNLNGIISESNIVTVITVGERSQSILEFLRYAPANPAAELVTISATYFSPDGAPSGPFELLPPPLEVNGVDEIDLGRPLPLISSAYFAVGDPIFIRITDKDQNADSLINETVLITLISSGGGDNELLRLAETGVNTGIFTGYIQSGIDFMSGAYDGFILAQEGYNLQGNYTDIFDSQDVSSDTLTFVRAGTSMYIIKLAGKNTVAAGDYLQYSLKIENATTITLDNISVYDNLPYSTRYQPGSTTFDGVTASDPQISPDGKNLAFAPGALAPGQSREIRYVVEIGPTAKPGRLTNQAFATDAAGTISNIATATVRVREELFRSDSFIAGRVIIAECDTASVRKAGQGITGARIYLEDGAYAVTDSNGMFHFEGISEGTHVLQLDRESLPPQYEAISCQDNSQFAGSPYSRFVDIQAGNSWQADFEVRLRPKPAGELRLKLSSNLRFTTITYEIDLAGSVVALHNLRLMIMLPEQVKYIRGTSRLPTDTFGDPTISGGLLTYQLGNTPEDWSRTLSFDVMLRAFDTTAELITECLAVFDTPESANQKTQVVRNTLAVTARRERRPSTAIVSRPYYSSFTLKLDSISRERPDDIAARYRDFDIKHIYIRGHSDSSAITPEGRPVRTENYAFSPAHAREVGEYLARVLNLDSSQITLIGVGPDEPPGDASATGGKDFDRRIDIGVISEKSGPPRLIDIAEGEDSVSAVIWGSRPGEPQEEYKIREPSRNSFAEIVQKSLDGQKTGFEWLWPAADYNPPIPSLKVAVKHYPDKAPRLFLDGEEISSLNFSETVIGQSDSIAVSTWTGIDINEGINLLEAVAYDSFGRQETVLSRPIHYSGPPVGVEVVDSLSYLVADSRRPAVIAVRFTDADGYPARPGVIGEWSVDPPYMAQQDIEEFNANPLLRVLDRNPKFAIGENGVALIELQASSRSGEALLRFHLIDHEKEIRVWLKPKFRDWVLVGLADRTLGYRAASGNRDNMANAGIDNRTYSSGRASFFARGGIKGDRLLTLAFDSKRLNADPDSGIFRTVNPESYYPLYGDGMEQGYDVSSSRGIYARIEGADYYGMFGDFNTALNVTELSRYNRTFNGLKLEGGVEKRNMNLFLSRSDQAFVKDEIPGDGTSGPYRFSRENIIANTERVVIETRDRFQNDVIISSERMRQFLDYQIDYYNGSIIFKRPVPSRDERLNPIFITVDYESHDSDDRSYNFGGRGAIDVIKGYLNVGGTYIHEGRIGGYGHLGGVDATLEMGNGLQLKTEFAASKVKEGVGRASGNALLVELKREMNKLSGEAYIRSQEPDFGLGQQSFSEQGTRKYGANATFRMRESLALSGQASRQLYLVTHSQRDLGEFRINMTNKRAAAQAGIRYAEDRLGDGVANRSSQLIAGGSYNMWAERLELRLVHEQSIIKNDNPDFPTRTTLGAEYRISRRLSFFGQQDFATGSKQVADDTRFGFLARPWKGAQLNSNITRSYNENAQRLFSNIGLIQAWQINEKLSLDFMLDHGRLITRAGDLNISPNQIPASGSLDGYTAFSVGGSYREKQWSSAARIEFRDSKTDDKLGITTNLLGEPREGLGLLWAARINKDDAAAGLKKRDSDIRFGLVYRPRMTKWLALNRLDFIFSKQKGGQFAYNNWRLVDNLTLNRRFSNRVSAAFQYGAKYLREIIGPNRYRGYTDIVGLESRYNFGRKWDVGARLSLLHSWNLGQYRYGGGISVGYSIVKNAWAGAGYNIDGFDDRDFSDGNFTARGPYLQFRFKFDDMTAREIAGHLGF